MTHKIGKVVKHSVMIFPLILTVYYDGGVLFHMPRVSMREPNPAVPCAIRHTPYAICHLNKFHSASPAIVLNNPIEMLITTPNITNICRLLLQSPSCLASQHTVPKGQKKPETMP